MKKSTKFEKFGEKLEKFLLLASYFQTFLMIRPVCDADGTYWWQSNIFHVSGKVLWSEYPEIFQLTDVMADVTVPSSLHPHHLTLYHIAARYNHAQLLHKLLAFYHMRSMLLDKEQAEKIGNTIGLEMDSYDRIPIHYAMSYGRYTTVTWIY